jgi:hypothetical protein
VQRGRRQLNLRSLIHLQTGVGTRFVEAVFALVRRTDSICAGHTHCRVNS